jgi:four helix bundle protein
MLRIYSVAVSVVGKLRPVIETIERKDSDLGRQMRRAASSVVLNMSEGMYSRGGNRRLRYHSAMGSMRETQACVEVGVALGYIGGIEAELLGDINRIMATLVKLTA